MFKEIAEAQYEAINLIIKLIIVIILLISAYFLIFSLCNKDFDKNEHNQIETVDY